MKKLLLLMIIPAIMLGSCGKKGAGENPFFTEWTTEYGMPPFDKIKPEHYKPAYEEAMRRHTAEIEAIKSNPDEPSFENVIFALDDAGKMLSQVSSVFGMVNSADSNDELRAIEQEMSPILTAHLDDISLDPALFAKVKAVYDNRNELSLNELQMRLLDKRYRAFVRSGALLDDTQKEQLRKMNTDLAALGVKFRANLLAETQKFVMVLERDDLAGLPDDLRAAGAEVAAKLGHDGKWAFTLDHRIPFLTYSENRPLREQMYTAYIERCNHDDEFDNKAVVNDIARLSLERANLLGYESFATYTLENRMAKTPQEVYALLDELWTPGLEGAKREVQDMRAIKIRETGDPEFAAWDWWFYAEKVRKERYDLQEEELKPYFSLPQVQSGIFDLANRLYGITFEPVKLPVYNQECATYRVLDADGSHLSILMLDMHPREGKRGGAWCGAYRSREFNAAGEKTFDPIVYITCNFTRPVGSKAPALLTLEETETFFHEFGHALHNFFNMSPYKGLMSTERDFVELPSQVMENWAFQPELLRQYAVKWNDKGAVIPERLIEKIANAAYFNQGFIMTEYLAASLIDMDIYTITEWKPLDINAYERDLLNTRRGLIEQIAPRYRFPYFNHIFGSGYAAGYYGYKWAEVLDKDAYEAFAETGDIFNKEVAERFRREVLSKGGTADGMVLYHNFRGKDPNLDYLLYASGLKERPKTDEEPILLEVADPIDM